MSYFCNPGLAAAQYQLEAHYFTLHSRGRWLSVIPSWVLEPNLLPDLPMCICFWKNMRDFSHRAVMLPVRIVMVITL